MQEKEVEKTDESKELTQGAKDLSGVPNDITKEEARKADEEWKKKKETEIEPDKGPALGQKSQAGKEGYPKEPKEKIYSIEFTEKDLQKSRIKRLIKDLINEQLNLQRDKKYYEVSETGLFILKKLGGFVPKEKYDNKTRYPNEEGKFKGKRVIKK